MMLGSWIGRGRKKRGGTSPGRYLSFQDRISSLHFDCTGRRSSWRQEDFRVCFRGLFGCKRLKWFCLGVSYGLALWITMSSCEVRTSQYPVELKREYLCMHMCDFSWNLSGDSEVCECVP